MGKNKFISLGMYHEYDSKTMKKRARDFYLDMARRRSVRQFSDRPVPLEIIENCIRAAGTAPSGANMQPWFFAVVRDREIKRKIRTAAEQEEMEFYQHRASKEWLQVLTPLGTGASKPFLETAPYLIVIFTQRYHITKAGEKIKHYYINESVGIATGLLITAVHRAGLVSLTHTPNPMNFLNKILERPVSEKPFLILVLGYPARDARVPDIRRKPLSEVSTVK